MSKHPNATAKKTATNAPAPKRYTRGSAITLDGQPARLDMPRTGKATVSALGSTRRMSINADRAREIVAAGGQFESPSFARPRQEA